MPDTKDYFVENGSKPSNNFVLPLINGKEAWEMVKNQIDLAKESIHLCFWGFESGLELIREKNEMLTSPNRRKKNNIYNILYKKKKEGVKIRILLWDYPLNATANFADILIKLSGRIGAFEVIYQPHPTRVMTVGIGSWHQKTIVIDNTYAFVSGMNAKENDWDTSDHFLFDGRRAGFRLDSEERRKINAHKSFEEINSPRRDYMAFVIGPAVTDVQLNFIERWNHSIDEEYLYYRKATKIRKLPARNADFSDVSAQITRTMPSYSPLPRGEKSILSSYIKAIGLAERYIYIEDQYFRSEEISREIVKAIQRNRNLKIIVVTQQDYLGEAEPGESWGIGTLSSYWSEEAYNLIKSEIPNFVLFDLKSSMIIKGKRMFKSINIHSKIMIDDDEWYTIGSANINERSFENDGELNIAVQHASALGFRKRVFSNLLNGPCPDNIDDAVRLWYEHASFNYSAFEKGSKPKSLIFPFAQSGPLLPILPPDWV